MKHFSVKMFLIVTICLIGNLSNAQTVGLVLDSYVIDRWYKDQKLFVDRVKELGGNVKVEVANGDPAEQLKKCKALIAGGVKVLVVVAVDGKKAIEIAKVAKAAKVPLISYDRFILSPDVALYISYHSEQVGELQAKYALSKVPKGNYILVSGPISDNNSVLIKKGQLKTLRTAINSKDIKILEDLNMEDWGEKGATTKMNSFFSNSKEKPSVIIAANDALASGVIKALPADLLGKVLVTGQDADLTAIQHIIDGTQTMTIYKPIKPLAYLAAESAMDLAKGQPIKDKTKWAYGNISVDAILLNPIVVDKNNYKSTVVKDGHIAQSGLVEKK
jgi:D-xylose transport system substrate-binding protein